MSERPTLTISVACPTCGGTTDARFSEKGKAYSREHGTNDCPDCTDGTIRQAVSCQSCRHRDRDAICHHAYVQVTVPDDWGCKSWEAKA